MSEEFASDWKFQMATWTFVVEFQGGTYCSQFQAHNLQDAVSQYNKCDPSGMGAIPLGADAVELNGLKSIFCASGLSGKEELPIFANIVRTEIST